MTFDPNAESVALRSIEAMSGGSLPDFEAVVHPEAINHEAESEPPDTRQAYGPAAWLATSRWLRAAFADLTWAIHEIVAERDLVVVHCTMSGRHTGDFVSYDATAAVKVAFPPTHRAFAVKQTHWFRVADGKVIEHWANRDDLGMGEQLGWTPPSPVYLLRMALAKRRAR